jgi:hypothetical protein
MRYEDSNSATTSSMYEDTSGNIGIKKTTPGAALDVNGSGIITGSLNVSGIGYLASVTSSQDIQVNGLTVGRGRNNDISNVALGSEALKGPSSLSSFPLYSVAVGQRALFSIRGGINNTAVGINALNATINGNDNTGLGNGAGSGITDGSQNTAVGSDTLSTVTTGNNNTAVGQYSLYGLVTGNYNVGIGSNITGTTIGDNNTVVGSNVALGTGLTNNIILATGDGSIKYRYASNNTTISGSLTIDGSTDVVQQGIQISGVSSLAIASISTVTYRGAFLDYVLSSDDQVNRRAGTLTLVWTASDIEWKDTSTMDIGNTDGVEFAPTNSGSNANIILSLPGGDWTVRGHLRYM